MIKYLLANLRKAEMFSDEEWVAYDRLVKARKAKRFARRRKAPTPGVGAFSSFTASVKSLF